MSDYMRMADSSNEPAAMIALRVPGPWVDVEQLNVALVSRGTSYHVDSDSIVDEATGRRLHFVTSDHDDDIGPLFRDGHHGRMTEEELLALGTPDELKGSIGADTIVTVSADGDLGLLAEQLKARVEGLGWVTTFEGTLHVAVRGTDRVLLRVISAADDAGFAVRDVQVAPPTLETVFINLTGKELRD